MKRATLLFYLLFVGITGYGQRDKKTIIVDLDKAELTEDPDKSLKWLSVKSGELLVIKLINGNPLKYTYKIGTEELSFFNDANPELINVQELAHIIATDPNGFVRNRTGINDYVSNDIIISQSINLLNVDFDILYMRLKGSNTINETDLRRRDVLLERAKMNREYSVEQLRGVDNYKTSTNYREVKEKLADTDEKAKESLNNVLDKLYSFDLEVSTLPIDIQGKSIDAVEFRITRFDKETKEEDKGFAPHPYNVWVRGGFKIDVSAGIFFTSLFDDAFEKKDDPAIADNKIITKKNLGEYDFAFGSSINIHSRWNSWLNMGGNLGVAFTTNQKFQVLTGINFIFGKQERIILSTGLSMGKVERLADSYMEGGSYNLGAEGVIPTQSQFKFGHFFGITYNLSKVKKISLDKGIE